VKKTLGGENSNFRGEFGEKTLGGENSNFRGKFGDSKIVKPAYNGDR